MRVGWKSLARWLPALGVMAVIFVLSSQSGLRVSDDAAVDRPLRGLAHFVAYATLAGLLLFALRGTARPRLRDGALAVLIAVAYALSNELHQSFVPTRHGRLEDAAIDLMGALAGTAVVAVLLHRHNDRATRSSSDPG